MDTQVRSTSAANGIMCGNKLPGESESLSSSVVCKAAQIQSHTWVSHAYIGFKSSLLRRFFSHQAVVEVEDMRGIRMRTVAVKMVDFRLPGVGAAHRSCCATSSAEAPTCQHNMWMCFLKKKHFTIQVTQSEHVLRLQIRRRLIRVLGYLVPPRGILNK